MRSRSIFAIAFLVYFAVANNRDSLFAADLSAARDNFEAQCAKCHGKSGRGDGPAGAPLATKPRNFSDCSRMAKESDQRMFDTIKGGGASVGLSKDMQAWGQAFEDQEIEGLVAYIRQFCKAPSAMNK